MEIGVLPASKPPVSESTKYPPPLSPCASPDRPAKQPSPACPPAAGCSASAAPTLSTPPLYYHNDRTKSDYFVNAQELLNVPRNEAGQFLVLALDHQGHRLGQFVDAEFHAGHAEIALCRLNSTVVVEFNLLLAVGRSQHCYVPNLEQFLQVLLCK